MLQQINLSNHAVLDPRSDRNQHVPSVAMILDHQVLNFHRSNE